MKKQRTSRPRASPRNGVAAALSAVPLVDRLAIALLAGSSLAFLPSAFTPYAWVKLLLAAIAALLALWRRPENYTLPPKLVWLGGALIAWLALTTLLSSHPATVLTGRWPRFEGVPTLVLYGSVAAAGARMLSGGLGREAHGRDAHWAWLQTCLSIAAVIVAAVAVVQLITDAGSGYRPGSTLGNATDMALWAVLVLGALLPTALRLQGWTVRAGTGAATLIIAVSGSRAGYVGLAIVVMAIVALDLRRHATRRALLGPTAILVVTGAVAVLVPTVRQRLLDTGTIRGRWMVWSEASTLVVDHPVAGVGLGGFVDAIPEYHTLDYAKSVGMSMAIDSPHTWPLQLASAGGLPALLLGLAAVAICAKQAVSLLRRTDDAVVATVVGTLAGLAAYLFGLLSHFSAPSTMPLAALLAGAALGVKREGLRGSANWLIVRPMLVFLAAYMTASTVSDLQVGGATAAAADGRTLEARHQIDLALRIAPWHVDTHAASAQAFAGVAANGVPSAAGISLESADRFLSVVPDSVEIGMAKAVSLNALGRSLEAKAILDELESRAPHYYALRVQRAIAWFGLGDKDRALADLVSASELEPSSPTPWTVMARIYTLTGDAAQADTAANEAALRSTGPR